MLYANEISPGPDKSQHIADEIKPISRSAPVAPSYPRLPYSSYSVLLKREMGRRTDKTTAMDRELPGGGGQSSPNSELINISGKA
jgi:hypothetical protein